MAVDEGVHSFLRNGLDAPVHAACILLDKVVHQHGNIFAAIAQRRHTNWKYIQSIEEVAAELAIRNASCQIAVRRRDQTQIHFDGARAPKALKLMVLQDTQELGLHFQRYFSHLIQEQSALVGKFHTADLLRDGSGEGPFLVAEEFTLQQAGRNGGTIYFNKAPVLAAAHAVERACDKLFARTRLPEDENGGVAAGNGCHLLQDLFEYRTLSHDFLEVRFRADFPFEVFLLLRQPVLEFVDLARSVGIFQGDRELGPHLIEQCQILRLESIQPGAGQGQSSNGPAWAK